jgi:hypothetical protein
VTGSRRVALALIGGLYLAAALVPCPPAAPPARGAVTPDHAGHAAASAPSAGMPCHESAPSVDLVAPCPCGCDERSGAAPAGARLGLALLAAAPELAAPARPCAFGAPGIFAPDAPPIAIDRVPWPATTARASA